MKINWAKKHKENYTHLFIESINRGLEDIKSGNVYSSEKLKDILQQKSHKNTNNTL